MNALALLLACGSPAVQNRLEAAASPYLRRHAADPVAWSPWDDAALARAREEGRPIFVSVGYLACHWCAVMHEESFRDPEIASLLEDYVAIKVDREERPDVDAALLPVVRAWTGSAGWPFTVILAPDLTPIFAASYLPPRDGERGFARGLATVLRETSAAWTTDPAAARTRGAELAERIRASRGLGGSAGLPPPAVCTAQRERLLAAADPEHGGFGRGAKFPQASAIERLLPDPVAVTALDAIATSALRDPVRGGFFRYTTDRAWTAPHFEKMLADQAALARLYLVGAERVPARREVWRQVADETLAFALRELALPGGGYGSGLDARSGGREGAFYLWTADELRRFGADPAVFGIPGVAGPARAAPGTAVPAAWRAAADARERPERDDKIVAAWNGQLLSALALGGFALERPDLLAAADRLADRLEGLGAPLPRVPGGPPGVLEDQALVALGLLDLHAATGDGRRLAAARRIWAAIEADYGGEGGGWVRVAPGGFRPWGPERPVDDGPEPSGTAAAAEVGQRLALLDGTDPKPVRLAFERVADALRDGGFFASGLCDAYEQLARPPPEIVLALPPGADAAPMLRAAAAGIGRGWVLARAGDPDVPIARDKEPVDGLPTAYVCRGGVCELPSVDPAALRARLTTSGR